MNILKFLLFVILTSDVVLVYTKTSCEKTPAASFLSSPNILSRAKRFLIFPKGANVINTAYFVKQLLGAVPSGFNLLMELDIFWPLPYEPRVFTTVRDLIFGQYKRKPNIPVWLNEPKKPSYSTYPPSYYLKNKHKEWPEYLELDSSSLHDLKKSSEATSVWEKQHPGEIFLPPNSWEEGTINTTSFPPQKKYFIQGRSESDHDRIHNYAQQDRKELYDIIHEAFLKIGVDTTACLQRILCEVNHYLLPQGKSLLHDVFRVFFTFPITNGPQDSWSRAASIKTNVDCIKSFADKCPYSIVNFVLHSGEIF